MENGQPTDLPQDPRLSLSKILDDDSIEHLEHHKSADAPAEGWDEEATGKALQDGYCVECEGPFISSSGLSAPEPIFMVLKTNQDMCIAKLARITFARFALRPNIVKGPGNNIRPNR